MAHRTSFSKRHAVSIYFALVFIISYGAVLLAVGPGNFPPSGSQFAQLGVLVYLAIIAGPGIAGVAMTAVADGRVGLRDLLNRLGRWRVGARWYALALLPALMMAAVTVLLSRVSSGGSGDMIGAGRSAMLTAAIIPALSVGVFEEVGWTGFAVPHLRPRHSLFVTGMTIGVVWGLWHAPLFWEPDSLSGALPFGILLARLFAWLPPLRLLMVRVHDRTRSLPVVMLMHVLVSYVSIALAPKGLDGIDLLLLPLASAAVLWLLVGAVSVQWRTSGVAESLTPSSGSADSRSP